MPHHEGQGHNVEQVTGISNVAYDVMALLANKLEGLEAMEMYKEDAECAGDQELSRFVERLQEQDRQSVDQLKGMLTKRLK